MNLRHIFSITGFLLKTVYFSPFNNPSFFLLVLLTAFFCITGGMGKHETVLIMLIAGIFNRFMPGLRNNASSGEPDYDNTISQYCRLLPVKKGTFFFSYFITGLLYVVVLMSACLYIGVKFENPPIIASLCPQQTIMKTNLKTNEPYLNVEGVTLTDNEQPIQFTIPVNPSIIFGHLAATVLLGHGKIADSVFCRLCPSPEVNETKDNYSIFSIHDTAKYYSDYLKALPYKHLKILLLISSLCLLIFLTDLTGIYKKDGKGFFLWKITDTLMFVSYACLCLALFMDILLPDSSIYCILSILSHYKFYMIVFFCFILSAGTIRIVSFSIRQLK
jgi:hypothetical protein